MKTKITTFIFASLALFSNCWAQPVITGIIGSPLGTKTFGYTIPGAIAEGTAGANQSWNYSTIPYDSSTFYFKSIGYSTLSSTMQAAFPTGNAANEVYFGSTLALTQVFNIEATDFLYLGYDNTVFPVADTQLFFPHSYLTTHAGFTYDAYGTLVTPFGTFTNTVRLREISGGNFKYDYWQFSPSYKILMEYLVDTTTQVMTGQTFFKTEIPLSVNEKSENIGFDLFPNPNSGSFTLSVNTTVGNLLIEMMDMQGRVVYSSVENNLNAGFTKQISMENVADGVYMLCLITDGERQIKKVFIQK